MVSGEASAVLIEIAVQQHWIAVETREFDHDRTAPQVDFSHLLSATEGGR